MKSYIKVQTEVRQIKKISDRFTLASVSFGEKNKAGQWENVYAKLNFYGDHNLQEGIVYDIVGRMGVDVAYGDRKALLMIHVDTVAIAGVTQEAPKQTAPVQAPLAPTAPIIEPDSDVIPF